MTNVYEVPIEEVQFEVVNTEQGLAVNISFILESRHKTGELLRETLPLCPLRPGQIFSTSKFARYVLRSPWTVDELEEKLRDKSQASPYEMGCDVVLRGIYFPDDYREILRTEVNRLCGESPH